MTEISWAMAVLGIILLVNWYFGMLMKRVLKLSCDSTFFVVIGYLISMVIFQVVAIPFQIMRISLSMLTNIYVVIMVVLSIVLLCILKKNVDRNKKKNANILSIGCLLVIIVVQCVAVVLNMYNGSAWDSSHYNGEIVTAWATDTMRIFDQYTGKEMVFNWRECIFTYEMHSAAMCRLFNIHPMIYVHRVLASIEIIIYNIIIYNIGLLLFKNEANKATMVCGLSLIVNTYTSSLFLPSAFLWYRSGESKSMLANIVLPLLLYWIIQLNIEDRWSIWMMLLLSVVMGAGISNSAVFIMPIMLTICIVPLFLRKKDVKVLAKYVMCLLPCLLYIIIG